MRSLLAVVVMAALVWLSQPVMVAGRAHPEPPVPYHMGAGMHFDPAAELVTVRVTDSREVGCVAC